MSEHKLKSGDLVSIEPWDCEGVEPPWGWDHTSFFDAKSKRASRMNRVKLRPGTLGMVVAFDHLGTEDSDTHYNVLVGEKKLGIPFRFLHKVQT